MRSVANGSRGAIAAKGCKGGAMSVFANNRIQRAVGQGFFHTATLAEDGNQRLRYIYDCGAISDCEKERGERIDELLADTGKQAKLDILFLDRKSTSLNSSH